MAKARLPKKPNGKVSISIKKHADLEIRVKKPDAEPYRPGTQREKAWNVVKLMSGITVEEADDILRKLEPNIQGRVIRPIGWVADAIDEGYVELHKPRKAAAK